MEEIASFILAAVAAMFIGISKAGFGGGLGMLSTPLCVFALGADVALGVLLPLLSVGDLFSIYHYWGKWDKRNLWYLLPGVVVGVIFGVQLIGKISPDQLSLIIGFLASIFVIFQFTKEWVFRMERKLHPNHKVGVPFGIVAGLTSSFAHGAGPVVTIFLIPQKLSKEIFVGTMILVFTWVNWIKMPFFVSGGIINPSTLILSAKYFIFVPIGVWLGVWMNRRIPEKGFTLIIYIITLIAGIELIVSSI
ncbi:MAG: sulfite exporter TauE/SafE family protein [Verrucomicrobia bacterium]|nr:sulfite exporter TauE/SafE family protein [Verrucomicrobiota bacterium]MCF7709529.1 sulfite exporter TauE/SafE family protein [Verrucomicrobiota bacterium]